MHAHAIQSPRRQKFLNLPRRIGVSQRRLEGDQLDVAILAILRPKPMLSEMPRSSG
jgi:hypothetical protein